MVGSVHQCYLTTQYEPLNEPVVPMQCKADGQSEKFSARRNR